AMLIPLNQDTMDRHLERMRAGSSVLYDGDRVKPGAAAEGVQLCPLPLAQLARNILYYNTAAVAAVLRLVGVELKPFEEMLAQQFKRKGDAVVADNVTAARAGYDYAGARFKPYPFSLPDTGRRLAVATGNDSLAMGGVAAGVKFYCAYPMSPSTGVLMWMARHARQLGIMVRQVEDELGVINMAIGAAHTGCRAMCATSGGGFALMTEALGAAAMMEIPVVCINVQRAGPATGVPTKTEQGDLWQVLGAGQGDYPRIIAARGAGDAGARARGRHRRARRGRRADQRRVHRSAQAAGDHGTARAQDGRRAAAARAAALHRPGRRRGHAPGMGLHRRGHRRS